jgi:hypothetical protein
MASVRNILDRPMYLHATFTCVRDGCYLQHPHFETMSMKLYFDLEHFG